MKKLLLSALITIAGLAILAFGILYKSDGGKTIKCMYQLSLEEQLNEENITIIKVRIRDLDEELLARRKGYCSYNVTLTDRLYNRNAPVPSTFSITDYYDHPTNTIEACKAIGDEYIVILRKRGLTAKTHTCHNSAFVDASREQEVLQNIALRKE